MRIFRRANFLENYFCDYTDPILRPVRNAINYLDDDDDDDDVDYDYLCLHHLPSTITIHFRGLWSKGEGPKGRS